MPWHSRFDKDPRNVVDVRPLVNRQTAVGYSQIALRQLLLSAN